MGIDQITLAQGEADIIEPLQQALLAERINLEVNDPAIRTPDLLFFKIDGDGGIGPARGIIEQLVDLLLGQADGQNAVLETIIVENIGKTRSNYAAYAKILYCPWGMFAR